MRSNTLEGRDTAAVRDLSFSDLAHLQLEHRRDWNHNTLHTSEYETFLRSVMEFAEIVPLERITERRSDAIRLGLRFDVDSDPYSALFLASIEHHVGIPSTYFFLPTSDYYGTWDSGVVCRNSGIFDEMLYLQNQLGREIGYHDDCVRLFADFGILPEAGLRQELDFWRSRGICPKGICSHNSAYVYGVGSFEIWEGQSIESRTSGVINNQTLALGGLKHEHFGLSYDANFLREVRWLGKAVKVHGKLRENAEVMSRDVDFLLFLGWGGKCAVYRGNRYEMVAADVPWAKMPELIYEKGKGHNWLFMGHPNYFGKIPTVASAPDVYAEWSSRGLDAGRNQDTNGRRLGLVPKVLMRSVSSSDHMFMIGKKLFGRDFLCDPRTIRNRIRRYSRKHREGPYWENARPGVHFMAPYMERAFNLIMNLTPHLHTTSMLDLAGGCGNLGLALSLFGLKRYLLNDVDQQRLEWARSLFNDYGLELHCIESDMRTFQTGGKFDVVALLGWENFDITYEEAIAAARRAQALSGWLIMTYQDYDEYLLGGWERIYKEWHGILPPKLEEGLYIISRRKLLDILRTEGYTLMSLMYAGHERTSRGYYPQYVVCAQLHRASRF